jgi:hypothetical protein
MRGHVRQLVGETLTTVARGRRNTIVEVTDDRVLVETEEGHRNYASLKELQDLADRVFGGEEVEVPLRGRSAFHAAVLATLPEVDHALNPRRFWLRDPPGAFDAEYSELFQDEAPATAREGRLMYQQHRVRERSPILCRLKKEAALREEGRLVCEACGFDFARQYGALGEGFSECHHRSPLGQGEERETALEDLALLCANCHRRIHRSKLISVEELRSSLHD